jgi:predicted  nucleic acid-binding Zn-ribbon protein
MSFLYNYQKRIKNLEDLKDVTEDNLLERVKELQEHIICLEKEIDELEEKITDHDLDIQALKDHVIHLI